MNDYRHRIAKAAIRCKGEPVTLSPQLEDYNVFPELMKRISGREADFRVVLFLGFIDMTDVAITFPADNVVKVHVKHDFKAVDEESHRILCRGRGSLSPEWRRATRPLTCSRDCVTFYSLPETVEKGSLTAHWTQDGFLIIQSRKEATSVKDFPSERLVPIKVCFLLDPCLNLNDVSCKAQALLQSAMRLWTKVGTLVPRNEFNDLFGNVRLWRDLGSDGAGKRGANADSQSGVLARHAGPLEKSEIGKKDSGSTTQSKASEEIGTEETGKKASEEIGTEETGKKAPEEIGKKDSGYTAQSKVSDGKKYSGYTGHSIVSEETVGKYPGSTVQKEVADESGEEDAGSSAEETGRRTTRSTAKSGAVADSKAVTEKTAEEKSSGSESINAGKGSQETAGSGSTAPGKGCEKKIGSCASSTQKPSESKESPAVSKGKNWNRKRRSTRS